MRIILAFLLQTIAINLAAQLQAISSGVYHWNELPVKKDNQRESRKIAEGTTPEFAWFRIHATTQFKGAIPRPPHAQDSIEEMVIIKEGTLKCTIGDNVTTLGPGSVLLIPPHEMQTFENTSENPVTYYVFGFRSRKPVNMERSNNAGGPLLLNYDSLPYKEANNKGGRKYFDRPTAMCENFEMHTTYLKMKGPSHAPHQHVETEIILMIEGESAMMIDGKNYTAGPGDIYIAESGKIHGIENTTDKLCSYFAFKWR